MLDKIDIKTRTETGTKEKGTSAPDTILEINGKELPYVTNFSLNHNADELYGPTLNLELAIFEDMFNYDGYGIVNIDDIEIKDKDFAEQLYKRLKKKLDK